MPCAQGRTGSDGKTPQRPRRSAKSRCPNAAGGPGWTSDCDGARHAVGSGGWGANAGRFPRAIRSAISGGRMAYAGMATGSAAAAENIARNERCRHAMPTKLGAQISRRALLDVTPAKRPYGKRTIRTTAELTPTSSRVAQCARFLRRCFRGNVREEDVPRPPATLARERDSDPGLPLRCVAMRPACSAP